MGVVEWVEEGSKDFESAMDGWLSGSERREIVHKGGWYRYEWTGYKLKRICLFLMPKRKAELASVCVGGGQRSGGLAFWVLHGKKRHNSLQRERKEVRGKEKREGFPD